MMMKAAEKRFFFENFDKNGPKGKIGLQLIKRGTLRKNKLM